jgi:fatty acid desaturase
MNHHKYLFTCQDPDHSRFHKIAGELHSASIGRKIWQVFVHLTLSVAEIKRIVAGPYKGQEVTSDKVAKRERLVSGILYACLLVLLSWFGVAHWLLLYWLLPLLIVTRTIATLRAIFEHEWSDQSGEVQKNTYNHYGSFLFEFMLFPHSINFHTTHHMYPYVPFYHIKSLTDHLQQVNGFGDSPRQTYHLRPFGSPREIRTMS